MNDTEPTLEFVSTGDPVIAGFEEAIGHLERWSERRIKLRSRRESASLPSSSSFQKKRRL